MPLLESRWVVEYSWLYSRVLQQFQSSLHACSQAPERCRFPIKEQFHLEVTFWSRTVVVVVIIITWTSLMFRLLIIQTSRCNIPKAPVKVPFGSLAPMGIFSVDTIDNLKHIPRAQLLSDVLWRLPEPLQQAVWGRNNAQISACASLETISEIN